MTIAASTFTEIKVFHETSCGNTQCKRIIIINLEGIQDPRIIFPKINKRPLGNKLDPQDQIFKINKRPGSSIW